MTRSLGPSLPSQLVERLAQRDPGARLGVAPPFVTVDGHGRPHPMLLSYLELRAYDTRTVGLVIGAKTRSAQNLAERHAGTLLVIEPDASVYVKLRAVDGPLPVEGGGEYALGYFLLEVEEVLEDAPADWEGGMRITGALRYAPAPTLDGLARHDVADQHAARLTQVEPLEIVLGDLDDGHTEPAPLDPALRGELRHELLDQVRRDREADRAVARRHAVDADDLARHVHERTAGVPGVDRGVGLDEVEAGRRDGEGRALAADDA